MSPAAFRLGFWSCLASFVAIVGYGGAQIAQVLGLVGYPLADVMIYGFSLCIAPPYLLSLVALQETISADRRMWMRAALLFGAIYVTYVALMYSVQLVTVIPRAPKAPDQGVLGVSPQSLFWVIDGLGYLSMGAASLFAGVALRGAGQGEWAQRLLLANGLITPVIGFVYVYPHFSNGLLMLGAPWLITAPGSMLALALYFRSLAWNGRGESASSRCC